MFSILNCTNDIQIFICNKCYFFFLITAKTSALGHVVNGKEFV